MKYYRRGALLVEAHVWIACISLATGFACAIVVSSMKLLESASADRDRLARDHRLAERFRADVGRAHALPRKHRELVANDQRLILAVGPNERVVYQYVDGRLERFETQDGVARDPEMMMLGTVTIQTEESRTVALILEETSGRHGKRKFRITAALGGTNR